MLGTRFEGSFGGVELWAREVNSSLSSCRYACSLVGLRGKETVMVRPGSEGSSWGKDLNG